MNNNILIYGAEGIARSAYEALHTLYPEVKIIGFLVTSNGINTKTLAGLPVTEVKEYAKFLTQEEKNNVNIVIATPEYFMEDIECTLKYWGMNRYIRLTSSRWSKLMMKYHEKRGEFVLHSLPIGCKKANIQMFMARSHKDKKLMEPYHLPDWIIPIQVGTTLSDKTIANIQDNEGDNISLKNVNYSELTAMYWIWKNRLIYTTENGENEYYGLCHYRRVFDILEEDVLRLMDNKVDVVLPYPLMYEPNINAHHNRYMKEEDWKAVWQALIELHPECLEDFQKVLEQKSFYNFNLILARKNVLRDYCCWLFPILERVEELSTPKADNRADRYIGYIGETLETLYFMLKKDEIKIVHTGYVLRV